MIFNLCGCPNSRNSLADRFTELGLKTASGVPKIGGCSRAPQFGLKFSLTAGASSRLMLYLDKLLHMSGNAADQELAGGIVTAIYRSLFNASSCNILCF